jgi:hypothetical protein
MERLKTELRARGFSVEEQRLTASPSALAAVACAGVMVALGGAGAVLDAALGAEVLVHEATFSVEEAERARETVHSTALAAAELARAADVGMLVLTHLSSRYFGPELAREARSVFPETVVPRDFDVVEIPYAERGAPRLVKGGAQRRRDEQPEQVPVP